MVDDTVAARVRAAITEAGYVYVAPDNPLRTGEPTEALIVAMREAVNGLGPTNPQSPLWAAMGRAALAVLRRDFDEL